MRLWHQQLISKLPLQQLLGLHREICALRGNSWGKKHSVVDYVFKHPVVYLITYHYLVMDEMKSRGYKVNEIWYNPLYRGKNCKEWEEMCINELGVRYPEHNDAYLQECIDNLKAKGITL